MSVRHFQNGDVLSGQDLNDIVQRVQSGKATLSGTGSTFAEVNVTFPIAFDTPPDVVPASVNATATVSIVTDARNVTETGFTLRGTATSGTFASSYPIQWIAVGAGA